MNSLEVNEIGKAFVGYRSEWQRIARWLYLPSRPSTEHWIIRNISFCVASGEAVGIVGQNGAGKSTLLKMISGTLQPSEGSIQINGRVSAILELGMGFNPDLTGRKNVYHAAGLMGFTTEEIDQFIPDIEAFADIGEYFDQPVRTYSSGMQVRLAFGIATAARPEILIIDEALAVGDAAFQRKCFQRIEKFMAEGTTLLFVSHDIETVKKMCNRAIFIKEGRLERIGPAKQVCDEYERYLFSGKSSANRSSTSAKKTSESNEALYDPALTTGCEMIYGSGDADIVACWLEDNLGRRINIIESGTTFSWCYRVHFHSDVTHPIFSMMLKTREGIAIFGTDSTTLGEPLPSPRAGEVRDIKFTLTSPLAPGVYYFNCGIRLDTSGEAEFLCRRIDAALLRVTSTDHTTTAIGIVEMQASLKDISVSTHDA
ncbi:ABC transporter ATP-binding protein [Pseudomonas sp. NY15437]|uniref:ABC transporter ATP-binding protein n=1 Tax=Pseudomonas sp. NY15437 TaxID=3400360 RepID=UPI003A8733EA